MSDLIRPMRGGKKDESADNSDANALLATTVGRTVATAVIESFEPDGNLVAGIGPNGSPDLLWIGALDRLTLVFTDGHEVVLYTRDAEEFASWLQVEHPAKRRP